MLVAGAGGGFALAGESTAVPHPAGREPSAVALRGVVRSLAQAAFTTDLAVPVATIARREGETFEKGERLVVFDCGRQARERDALAALEREAAVAVKTSRYLVERGAGNRNDVETAEARHDRARAEAAAMSHRLEACTIVAPFAGSVVELTIYPHETPVPGKPFLVITAHRQLEVEIIVPSRLVPGLAPGAVFQLTVDETQRVYPARIDRIAGVVDAVSQMVKVYARLLAPDAAVLPGMSGTATFAPPTGGIGP